MQGHVVQRRDVILVRAGAQDVMVGQQRHGIGSCLAERLGKLVENSHAGRVGRLCPRGVIGDDGEPAWSLVPVSVTPPGFETRKHRPLYP